MRGRPTCLSHVVSSVFESWRSNRGERALRGWGLEPLGSVPSDLGAAMTDLVGGRVERAYGVGQGSGGDPDVVVARTASSHAVPGAPAFAVLGARIQAEFSPPVIVRSVQGGASEGLGCVPSSFQRLTDEAGLLWGETGGFAVYMPHDGDVIEALPACLFSPLLEEHAPRVDCVALSGHALVALFAWADLRAAYPFLLRVRDAVDGGGCAGGATTFCPGRPLEDAVRSFVADECRVARSGVALSTRLGSDLGLGLPEGGAILESFGRAFGIDLSGLDAGRHFPQRGHDRGLRVGSGEPGAPGVDLTVADLVHCARHKRWMEPSEGEDGPGFARSAQLGPSSG